MEYPVKCNKCEKELSGPVTYCPFCGEPSDGLGTDVLEGVSSAAGIFAQMESKVLSPVSEHTDALPAGETTGPGAPSVQVMPPEVKEAPVSIQAAQECSPAPVSRQVPVMQPKGEDPDKKGYRKYIAMVLVVVLSAIASHLLFKKKPSPPTVDLVPSVSHQSGEAQQSKLGQSAKAPKKQVVLDVEPFPAEAPQSVTPNRHKDVTLGKRPPASAGISEKKMEERIQKALELFDNGQFNAASKEFRAILAVVPNNALAKFYLQRSTNAEKH